MAKPFNTRNYAWKDCEIRLNGRILTSIQGAAWNHKQDKTPIYGKGTQALKFQKGNESVEGSITVLQDELEAILDECPDRKLINLEGADLQIAFDEGKGVVVYYSIIGVTFTEEPHDHKTGDPAAVSTLPFLALTTTSRS